MTNLFLTQDSRFILGDIARILGWIINQIFNFLDSVGVANVGVAIILFTIIVYMLMIPLTYKQQKFSRMSMRMNPEIQAIQKKYKGKQDQASMLKMQDETKAVYAKYGTSPTGTCHHCHHKITLRVKFRILGGGLGTSSTLSILCSSRLNQGTN